MSFFWKNLKKFLSPQLIGFLKGQNLTFFSKILKKILPLKLIGKFQGQKFVFFEEKIKVCAEYTKIAAKSC